MSDFLFQCQPLVVNPLLAKEIGLNEAIVLQQMHYWQQKMGKEIYNSYKDWQDQFPWWSTKTIQRTVTSLESLGAIVTRVDGNDGNRKYYSINYSHPVFSVQTSGQNVQTFGQNVQTSGQIVQTFQATETTQRIPETSHTSKTSAKKAESYQEDPLWQDFENTQAYWNKLFGGRRKANPLDFPNYQYWRKSYDEFDIRAAVAFFRMDTFWSKPTFSLLLRQTNKDKVTPCDRIGDALEYKDPGNINLEALRSDYVRIRKWFDDGQPVSEAKEVFLALKHFGYDQLVADLIAKSKEQNGSN